MEIELKTTYYMIYNIGLNFIGCAVSFEARDYEEAFAIITAYKAGLASNRLDLGAFTLESLSTHKTRNIDFSPMVKS